MLSASRAVVNRPMAYGRAICPYITVYCRVASRAVTITAVPAPAHACANRYSRNNAATLIRMKGSLTAPSLDPKTCVQHHSKACVPGGCVSMFHTPLDMASPRVGKSTRTNALISSCV